MAVVIQGKTQCPLCRGALGEDDDIVAFPAFLGTRHELSGFSDAAFHQECFNASPSAAEVSALYARYTAIWDSRPKDLKTMEEIEAWGCEAFKSFR